MYRFWKLISTTVQTSSSSWVWRIKGIPLRHVSQSQPIIDALQDNHPNQKLITKSYLQNNRRQLVMAKIFGNNRKGTEAIAWAQYLTELNIRSGIVIMVKLQRYVKSLQTTRGSETSVYAAMTHIVFSIRCSCPNSFRPCLFMLPPVFLILFCIISIFVQDVANCYIVYMNDNIQGCESSIANQAESVDFNKLLFCDKYIWSVRRPG